MPGYSGITLSTATKCLILSVMDGLGDILRRRDLDEPAEVRAIKAYVLRNYDAAVQVTIQPHNIILSARSSGLIGSLRMNLPKLQAAANTEKRITFRIG